MHSFLALVLLGISALVAGHPEPTRWHPRPTRSSSSSLPWDVTCPASTPFTTIYITTYETIRPTTVTTTYDVTEMITRTVPTTATIARSCPSWYTEVGTPAPWQSCTFNTLTCITLACLEIRTRTAVCQTITDPCCTRTVTDTLYADCPTACPTGCGGTSYTTITLPCPTTA